jgi:acetyltransferase-like isoleucine patch superfamily enzyme
MNKPDVSTSHINNVNFGKNVKVIEPVNLYGCEIGDNSFIGPFVEIQKDVVIGKHCKIQSHTFICELVNIGDFVFVAHGVVFINDKFSIGGPANNNHDLWKNTNIGNHVSIGSNASILPVNICDNVVIGAGAVVTKDIIEPGTYVGNPAVLLRSHKE